MQIEQLQHECERVQADLANGRILPSVTVDEIRSYLASQYHFQKELPLDEVIQVSRRFISATVRTSVIELRKHRIARVLRLTP